MLPGAPTRTSPHRPGTASCGPCHGVSSLLMGGRSRSYARVSNSRFGAAYWQPDFAYPHIVNGGLVEVVLGSAAYGLVVRYR